MKTQTFSQEALEAAFSVVWTRCWISLPPNHLPRKVDIQDLELLDSAGKTPIQKSAQKKPVEKNSSAKKNKENIRKVEDDEEEEEEEIVPRSKARSVTKRRVILDSDDEEEEKKDDCRHRLFGNEKEEEEGEGEGEEENKKSLKTPSRRRPAHIPTPSKSANKVRWQREEEDEEESGEEEKPKDRRHHHHRHHERKKNESESEEGEDDDFINDDEECDDAKDVNSDEDDDNDDDDDEEVDEDEQFERMMRKMELEDEEIRTPTKSSKQTPSSKSNRSATKLDSEARTPKSATKGKPFARIRDDLVKEYFAKFNAVIFENKIPDNLEIEWSNRLNKTAGMTLFHPRKHPQVRGFHVSIQLATKVLDTPEKLWSTLCHELCHVAAWVVDGVKKPPHGYAFMKWAQLAETRMPPMRVGVCHNYAIAYKYMYACTDSECGATYGRHSKSVNLERQRCGKCLSQLRLLPRLKKDGTPAKDRTPSKYTNFCKEYSAVIRAQYPKLDAARVMQLVAQEWQRQKATGIPSTSSSSLPQEEDVFFSPE